MMRRITKKIRESEINFTVIIINILILIAILALEIVVGLVPVKNLLVVLLSVSVTVVIVAIVGYLIFDYLFNLTAGARGLVASINELFRKEGMFISNETLKGYEEKANKIRVISPDLYDDRNLFYTTILENIADKKKYDYIIPNDRTIKGRMTRLRKQIAKELNHGDMEIPIRYRVCDDFPIFTEYVIYEGDTYNDLTGFIEIRVNQGKSDTVNVVLSDEDTNNICQWFDEKFDSNDD